MAGKKATDFAFDLKDEVKLKESNEIGTVIARAEYLEAANGYLLRYRGGDGRQTEQWWNESAIEAV